MKSFFTYVAVLLLLAGCVPDQPQAEDGPKEPKPKTYAVQVYSGGTRIDWWSYATFPEQVAPDRWEVTDTSRDQKITIIGSNLVMTIYENQ